MVAYKLNAMEFPDLKLPNGARAASMRLANLFAELSRLGVPGIKSEMGKMDLLACYSSFVTERKQTALYNSGDEFIRAIIAGQDKAG